MGEYDKIIKENIEAVFLPLLEKFTGIKITESFEVKDKIQITLEREPDFLKKVIDQSGNEFILQLEFQTQNDAEMVYRMAEYQAIIQRKHELPVRQFVIYLGADEPNMRTDLRVEEQITGFHLQNIHDLKYDDLTSSKIPQEILLTILSDFTERDAEEVISHIIAKLQVLSGSQAELEGYLKRLIVLSRLRKLETITRKKVEAMPITYDITTDGLYQQGIEQGIEQGTEQKTYRAISKAIEQRILTFEQIAEMLEVSIDTVLQINNSMEK